MVIIASHHIYISYWSIPNVSAVFILIALYLLFSKSGDRARFIPSILCMIVLAAIILTHMIAATCMSKLLFVT
jgi:hypothetical protein